MPKITHEYYVCVSSKEFSLTYDFHKTDFRIEDGRWDMDGGKTEYFGDAYDIFSKSEEILKSGGWDSFKGEVYIMKVSYIVFTNDDGEEENVPFELPGAIMSRDITVFD